MNWYLAAMRKYLVIEGRARRMEYWMFFLFNVIICIILGVIDAVTGFPVLGFIYGLAIIIPSITVGVRRLHDIGKSGWWLLIALIPVIGGLVLLVFAVLPSNPGANDYGPSPLEA